jgi:hypothetical protein
MSEVDDDLRSTAETMSEEAARLSRIEAEKAAMDPGDPRLLALAEESEDLVDGLAAMAAVEKELASEAAR